MDSYDKGNLKLLLAFPSAGVTTYKYFSFARILSTMASASHLLNRFDEKTLGILEILVFLLAFEEMASLFATSSSKLLLNLYQY